MTVARQLKEHLTYAENLLLHSLLDGPKADRDGIPDRVLVNVGLARRIDPGLIEITKAGRAHVAGSIDAPERPVTTGLPENYAQFLCRFIGRDCLHATRDSSGEQRAVEYGLQHGWLRRKLGEVHFTPKGRKALALHGELQKALRQA
jgi:hypothetical protein